jgi:hypothetical protein
MLHELPSGIFNTSYIHDLEPGDEDFLLCYRDNQVLLKKSGEDYEMPRKRDFNGSLTESPIYLFTLNAERCFGIIQTVTDLPAFENYDLFVLRNYKQKKG